MMHYGAILAKGEVGYTNLDRVFAALGNIQENYNWLITDCECTVAAAGRGTEPAGTV